MQWSFIRSNCTASLLLFPLFLAFMLNLLFRVINRRLRRLLLLKVLIRALFVISGQWYAKPGHFVGGQVEVPQDLVALCDELD